MHVFPDFFAVVKDQDTARTQKLSSSVQLSSLHPIFDASPTHRGRIVTKCIQPDGGCTFLQISPRSSKMKPRRDTEVILKCSAFISASSLSCIANATRPHSYKAYSARWRMHVFADFSAVVKDEAAAFTQK